MSAGFSALSSALFALAWTIPPSRFITLIVVEPFSSVPAEIRARRRPRVEPTSWSCVEAASSGSAEAAWPSGLPALPSGTGVAQDRCSGEERCTCQRIAGRKRHEPNGDWRHE